VSLAWISSILSWSSALAAAACSALTETRAPASIEVVEVLDEKVVEVEVVEVETGVVEVDRGVVDVESCLSEVEL